MTREEGYERTDSWDDVEARWEKLEFLRPLVDLVRGMRAAGWTLGLLPVISMHTLCMFRSAPWVRGHEGLEIDYDSERGQFEMRYYDGGKVAWSRVVPPDQALEAIERFLFRRARWLKRTG